MKLLSVAIPCYNSENYMRHAVETLVVGGQDMEIIIVDDGSTDSSIEIVKEYCEKDSRFNLFCKEHCEGTGAGPARNLGFSNASGKYVLFLDSDDYFELNMLEELYCTAERECVQVVISNAFIFDNNTKNEIEYKVSGPLDYSLVPEKSVFSGKDISDKLFQLVWGAAWNIFLLREFVIEKGLRFQATRFEDDVLFTYTALAEAEFITVLNEKFVHYRINTSTCQTATKYDHMEIMYSAPKKVKEELEKRGLFEDYKISYWNRFLNPMIKFLYAQKDAQRFAECYELLRGELKQELALNDFLNLEMGKIYRKDVFYSYKKIVENTLVEFLFYEKNNNGALIDGYWFPNEIRGKKIILYGAGNAGKKFYGTIWRDNICTLIGWVDINYQQIGYPVQAPEIIKQKKFDYVLIAIVDERIRKEVKCLLEKAEVEKDKILEILDRRAVTKV